MARNLSSSLQSKLATQQLVVADLLELHLDTPVYLTNASIDINYDSATAPDAGINTYTAQGQFIGFGNVSETADIRVGSIDISFTAVDLTTIALVTNNEYIDRRIVIYRAILDNNNNLNTQNVFQYFDGRITTFSIQETEKTATLTIQCATQFADFEKQAGRTTNVASQQIFFPNDKGMEFSAGIVKDIKWGRA